LVIGKYLADGRDVDLGEFGEFKISISAKAVDTLEEVTAETIRRPRVIYRMGKEWRNLLEETPKVLGSLDMKGYKSRKSTEQENP
jgi:predicted histone-like DNA-binding protein